jgi:hypothetical protein
MPDELDLVQDVLDREMQNRLDEHKNRGEPEIVKTGFCLSSGCGEPTEHKWCGPECRDDWQHDRDMQERRRRINRR